MQHKYILLTKKKYQILSNEKDYALTIELYENINIQLIVRQKEDPPL